MPVKSTSTEVNQYYLATTHRDLAARRLGGRVLTIDEM